MIRKSLVILVNLGSIVALFVMVFLHEPTRHTLPGAADGQSTKALNAAASPDPSPTALAAPPVSKASDGPSNGPSEKPEEHEAADVAPRIVRVTALGWELLAPAILANRGVAAETTGSSFHTHGVATTLAESKTFDDLERAIALGGENDAGADIALLPLAAFVHRYERLRALKPQVFFVIGWSVGRDALYIKPDDDFDNVRRSRTIPLVGTAGETETLLSLAVLRFAGTPLSKTILVSTSSGEASLAAVDRSRDDSRSHGRRAFLTTADVPHLCPYVAIASEGFLEEHQELAYRWSQGWLDGVRALAQDVPAAARRVGELGGTPETVAIVRRLGQLDFVGLRQNAELAGLSGRGAVTLERLFEIHWSIWREAGEISIPPPAAPVFSGAVAWLARSGSSEAPHQRVSYDMTRERLISIKLPEQDPVAEIGLVAGLFASSGLSIGVRGRRTPGARALIEQSQVRYALDPGRFAESRDVPRGMNRVLHVLRTP